MEQEPEQLHSSRVEQQGHRCVCVSPILLGVQGVWGEVCPVLPGTHQPPAFGAVTPMQPRWPELGCWILKLGLC